MNVIQIFSTPIWNTYYPDFLDHKDEFLKCVKKFRESNPEGVKKSNINGYQSPMNLTKEPEMSPLFEYVCQIGMKAVFDMELVDSDVYLSAAWVNILDGRFQYNCEHEHQDTFSGVFYLQVPENSGKLSIMNPGMNTLWQGQMLVEKKNKFNSDKLRLVPEEGQIYLWPSYLSHSVEPNNHDDTRISISFNVICIPKVPVEHTK